MYALRLGFRAQGLSTQGLGFGFRICGGRGKVVHGIGVIEAAAENLTYPT